MGRIREENRKRTQHAKVRSGCDQCKKRRIKCGEEKPSCRRCVIAKLDCDYSNVPKAKVDALEEGVTNLRFYDVEHEGSGGFDYSGDRRSSNSSTEYGQPAAYFYFNQFTYPTPESSAKGSISDDESSSSHALSAIRRNSDTRMVKSPSPSVFEGTFESSAKEYQFHWLTHYTAPRSVIPRDVWLQRIHQHAHHFEPIRDLIVAMGSIGLSLAQGHDEKTHHGVLQRVHKYTNHAILGLGSATAKVPTIVMLYCCWMFWQLDLIRGDLVNSYLHVQSAHKIAAEAAARGDPVDEAELGGLFGSTGPIFMIDVGVCPAAFSAKNTPLQRQRAALPLIMGTIRDLSEMILRVSTDTNIPVDARSEIVKTLEGCRKDEEWLLFQWAGNVASDDLDGAISSHDGSPENGNGSVQTPERDEVWLMQPWQMDLRDVVEMQEVAPLCSRRFQLRVQQLIPDRDIIVGCSPKPDEPSSEYRQHPSIIDVYEKALDLAASQGFTPEAVASFKMYALQFALQISQLVGQDDYKMRQTLLRMLERQRLWQGT